LTAGELAPALAELEPILHDEASEHKLPSLAVGVVTDEGLVWFRGFGVRDLAAGDPVTADTVFRIGSITKVVTGMALLALRDAGKLSLDEPAQRLLPELAGVLYPTRDSPLITLRHLVTHTSGLPRMVPEVVDYSRPDHEPPGEAKVLRVLDGLRLGYVTGTRQLYSNLAMALAGLMVARASGQPWRAFVREHILAPLGMTETAFDRSEVPPAQLATGYTRGGEGWKPVAFHWRLGALDSAGVLYSSVTDLARLLRFQLSAWPPRDQVDAPPLRRASLRESQQRIYGEFGVNWVIDRDVVWHNGGTEAYRSMVAMVPQRGVAIIALTGCEDDSVTKIGLQALDRLIGRVHPQLGPDLGAALDRFLAFYEHPDAAGRARTISPCFSAQVPDLVALTARMRAETGACKVDRVESVEGSGQATVRLACQHKTVRLVMSIDGAPPHLVTGATIKPVE
jgi:CubicO group peptidase (beta-lactamase class C family)